MEEVLVNTSEQTEKKMCPECKAEIGGTPKLFFAIPNYQTMQKIILRMKLMRLCGKKRLDRNGYAVTIRGLALYGGRFCAGKNI